MYKRYMHIERWGTDAVDGIEMGECYVFPKIDGTSGVCWREDGEIKAGSRNRELTLEEDNAGFFKHIQADVRINLFFEKYPQYRLWGEWLVPHSLKTYKSDAWRKFYIFDVSTDGEEDTNNYLTYKEYQPLLEEFSLEYIPPIKILKNASYDNFISQMTTNNGYLIQDGKGMGEGVVIKNYDFYNKYQRQVWAKIVSNEFKEKHTKAMGAAVTEFVTTEQKISERYVTPTLVEKEYAKIVVSQDGWTSQYIPMLLGTIWNCIITEEMWSILKEFKNPTISFRSLNAFVNKQVKEIKSEIF